MADVDKSLPNVRQGGFLNHPEDYKDPVKQITLKEYY